MPIPTRRPRGRAIADPRSLRTPSDPAARAVLAVAACDRLPGKVPHRCRGIRRRSAPRAWRLADRCPSCRRRVQPRPATHYRGPGLRAPAARASPLLSRRCSRLVARTTPERESLDRWRNLEFQLEGLQSLRYAHYYRCLVEDAPDAEVVMITDLRDVVFQRDPFEDPVDGPRALPRRTAPSRSAQDGFNTRWLRNLYGREFVERLAGSAVLVLRHRRRDAGSDARVPLRDDRGHRVAEATDGAARPGCPQRAHPDGTTPVRAARSRTSTGRVLTLGRVRTPRSTDDGVLLNADGSVPAVIHQWDRHPSLVSQLRALRPADECRP